MLIILLYTIVHLLHLERNHWFNCVLYQHIHTVLSLFFKLEYHDIVITHAISSNYWDHFNTTRKCHLSPHKCHHDWDFQEHTALCLSLTSDIPLWCFWCQVSTERLTAHYYKTYCTVSELYLSCYPQPFEEVIPLAGSLNEPFYSKNVRGQAWRWQIWGIICIDFHLLFLISPRAWVLIRLDSGSKSIDFLVGSSKSTLLLITDLCLPCGLCLPCYQTCSLLLMAPESIWLKVTK